MKIYFLHSGMLSFVKNDLEIIRSCHEVRTEFNHGKAIHNIWKNCQGVLWSDLVFCWFASIHFLPSAILTKVLNRKLVVVAGGYDVVNLPEIAYGNMRRGIRKYLVKLILRLADRVIAISNSNYREAIENAKIDPSKLVMIYHGFCLFPEPIVPKERMVVTVGEVSWCNLKRKGLEDFVRVAKFFEDIPFKLIGRWSDDSYKYLLGIATPNVEITGFLDDASFSDMLSRAKVYVQASRHEGFGCAVAEAMLYECIPVVTDVFSLPEVVDDCGFMVSASLGSDLIKKIKSALYTEEFLGKKARKRILEKFPLHKRKEVLLNVLTNV